MSQLTVMVCRFKRRHVTDNWEKGVIINSCGVIIDMNGQQVDVPIYELCIMPEKGTLILKTKEGE